MRTDLGGLRRFVDETLGGPRRAADELAAGLAVLHAAVVAAALALTWFDATDVQLLLDARGGPADAIATGTTPGVAVLAWALTLAGSFPRWAAITVLTALVLLVDAALWWLLREVAGRRLRTLAAFVVVLLAPPLTAAATDLSTGLAVLPATGAAAASVAAATRRRRLGAPIWTLAVGAAALAAVVFLPSAGLVAVGVLLVAARPPLREAAVVVVAVLAGVGAWVWSAGAATVGATARATGRSLADGGAGLAGWPVWWRSTDHGLVSGVPLAVLAGVGVLAAGAVAVSLRRRPVAALAVLVGVVLAATAPAVLGTAHSVTGLVAPLVVAVAAALGLVVDAELPRGGLRRSAAAGLAGVAVTCAVASVVTLVVVRADADVLADYVGNVETTARRTGTIELADTDVGPRLIPPSVGTPTVAELFAESAGVEVLRAGNDLRVANPVGFLKLATIVDGVLSPAPEPGSCGTLVRRTASDDPVVVGEVPSRAPRADDWVAVDYVASQDDTASLAIDGAARELPVVRGPHTYLVRIGAAPVEQVALTVSTPGSTVCVARVRVGPLIASEFS